MASGPGAETAVPQELHSSMRHNTDAKVQSMTREYSPANYPTRMQNCPRQARMLSHTFLLVSLAFLLAQVLGNTTESAQSNRHIVVVVWDGMRPDFISDKNTPTLWKLAHKGVIFRNDHAVFPSATNVNGTALVTGVYPGRNGLIANHDYRPEIDRNHSIDVELAAVVAKGDELSNRKYISVPTIAELVQNAGGRTAIATAKTVGLLLDRHVDPGRAKDCITLFAGK